MHPGTALRAAAFLLASVVILALVSPLGHGAAPQASIAVGAVSSVLTLVLTILFLRFGRGRVAAGFIAPDRRTATRFSAGLIAGVLLLAVHTAILAGPGHVVYTWNGSGWARPFALACASFALLASREELAFRGYPLQVLAARFGAAAAQVAIAAAFALEHLAGGMGWWQALLGPGLGSLVFGMAALRTRGLAMPIGIHAAWNLGDWARGGKGPGGLWTAVVEPSYAHQSDIAGWSGYAVLMIVAVIVLAAFEDRTQSGPVR